MNSGNDKLAIILLGAGNSKRFGGRKQFYEIDGEMMYLHMLNKLKVLPHTIPILVTQFLEMKDQVEGFEIVMNESPEKGISHSIQLGIQALLEKKEHFVGILFAVCDQPYLSKESLLKLVTAYQKSEKTIACLCYGERMGNPVIFHPKYIEELLALSGDTGGKQVLRRHEDEVLFVEVNEEKELFDIDTKQDIVK